MADINVLIPILPILSEADPDWCIFSSAARLLDGEDVVPGDIDIMMSEEGAIRAEQLLGHYRSHVHQPESGRYLSRRSHYIIDGTHIDISGGLMRLRNGSWERVHPAEVKTRKGIRYTTGLKGEEA